MNRGSVNPRYRIVAVIAILLGLAIPLNGLCASIPSDCVRIPVRTGAVAFSRDGASLVWGSIGGATLRDLSSGTTRVFRFENLVAGCRTFSFSPNGRLLAAVVYNNDIGYGAVAWNLESGQCLWESWTSWYVWFLSNDLLLGGGGRILDGESGSGLPSLEIWEIWRGGVANEDLPVLIGHDDQRIHEVVKWEMDGLAARKVLTLPVLFPTAINDMALSSTGHRLATACGSVEIWDLANGKELLSIKGPEIIRGSDSYASTVELDPSGQILAVDWRDYDSGAKKFVHSVRLYDLATYGEIPSLLSAFNCSPPFAFSPDASQFLCLVDDELVVWNMECLVLTAPTAFYISHTDEVQVGDPIEVRVGFDDPNEDLVEVRITVRDSPSESTSLDLDQSAYQSQIQDRSEGAVALGFVLATPGIYQIQAEIVDAQGFASNPVLFAVRVHAPSPPSIIRIACPEAVINGVPVPVSVTFADEEADLVSAHYTVTEGSLNDFTLDLTQPPYADHVVGVSEGEFSFEIVPPKAGSYRLQLTLIDVAGLESEPFEFSFEAYPPTSPVIDRMTFPGSIGMNENQNGLVRFEDPEGDIVEARFEVIEGDASTIVLGPSLSFDPEVEGETDGAFRFTVRVTQAQTVTLRLILVDATRRASEPYEFTFDVR